MQGASVPAAASQAAAIARRAAIAGGRGAKDLPGAGQFVFNQQTLPCCVSCALAGAMTLLRNPAVNLSPLFVDYRTRHQFGANTPPNQELALPDALNELYQLGVCRHELYKPPFTPAGALQPPTGAAAADASQRRLKNNGLRKAHEYWVAGSRTSWIREHIDKGHPLLLIFRLPTAYPNTFLDSTGAWTNPDSTTPSASDHCVLVTGYNDLRGSIHIQDSRGSEAFEKGQWWMGYRVVDSSIVHTACSLLF